MLCDLVWFKKSRFQKLSFCIDGTTRLRWNMKSAERVTHTMLTSVSANDVAPSCAHTLGEGGILTSLAGDTLFEHATIVHLRTEKRNVTHMTLTILHEAAVSVEVARASCSNGSAIARDPDGSEIGFTQVRRSVCYHENVVWATFVAKHRVHSK